MQSESGPSSYSMGQLARSESPDAIKRKKVKLHRCPECQKDFPRWVFSRVRGVRGPNSSDRPSGLRTHMNTHTKERRKPRRLHSCLRSMLTQRGSLPLHLPGLRPNIFGGVQCKAAHAHPRAGCVERRHRRCHARSVCRRLRAAHRRTCCPRGRGHPKTKGPCQTAMA